MILLIILKLIKQPESVKKVPVVIQPEPEFETEEEEDIWETKRIYRNGWVMGEITQHKVTGRLSERDPTTYPVSELENLRGYEYFLIRKGKALFDCIAEN